MIVTFPSTASSVSAFNKNFMYPGHSISQTFTGTGLNTVVSMSFVVTASCVNLWSVLQWGVVVNNVQIGTFFIVPASGGTTGSLPMSHSFVFPTITGNGTYTLGLGILAGAGEGDGYVNLGLGTASITSS